MALKRAPVPCDGCTACCRGELLPLMPGDDPAAYLTERNINEKGEDVLTLQHKPNGECVYLGPDGCTIWDRAPIVCQAFDCRRQFLASDRVGRRLAVKQGFASAAVFEAGRKRLHTLPERTAL